MRRIDAPPANDGEELCDALLADDVARLRSLLDAGRDPNVADLRLGRDEAPPLQLAADGGDCESIALLLRAGADVNARSGSGWTALLRACNGGHLEAARMLLDAGADPKVRNDEGYSAWGRIPGQCHELSRLLAERGGAFPR
jgi:ankyrin repeat protein